MSWKATAAVKAITKHVNGTAITATEKLVLFILADYHNDSVGCSWASVERLAEESLLSVRQFSRITQSLASGGLLVIQKRQRKTNVYRFPFLQSTDFRKDILSFQKVVRQDISGSLTGHSCVPLTSNIEPQEEKTFELEAERGNHSNHLRSFPEGFHLTEQMRKEAVGLEVSEPGKEFDAFRDYHIAKGSRFKDWTAAWRTWCRNSTRFSRPNGQANIPSKKTLQQQLDELMSKERARKQAAKAV